MRQEPTIQFELEDIKRAPVHYNTVTHVALCQSTQEAIKFPVALAEVFGDEDVAIFLELVPKHLHHLAENEEEMLLKIMVGAYEDEEKCTVFMNMSTLNEHRVGKQLGFHAVEAAKEVYRTYKRFMRSKDGA